MFSCYSMMYLSTMPEVELTPEERRHAATRRQYHLLKAASDDFDQIRKGLHRTIIILSELPKISTNLRDLKRQLIEIKDRLNDLTHDDETIGEIEQLDKHIDEEMRFTDRLTSQLTQRKQPAIAFRIAASSGTDEITNYLPTLPNELFEIIAASFCLTDFLAIQQVCTTWRDFINNFNFRFLKNIDLYKKAGIFMQLPSAQYLNFATLQKTLSLAYQQASFFNKKIDFLRKLPSLLQSAIDGDPEQSQQSSAPNLKSKR